MKLRIGRILLTAVLAEVLGVLALFILVGMFGPPGFKAAQPFAEHLGMWVGPISGFLLCVAGGYWVARGAGPYYLPNGVAMGVAGALVDAASALPFGGTFQVLMAISLLGRVVGGAIGGLLAAGSRKQMMV